MCRFLVVDDQKELRTVLSKAIGHAGYMVYASPDGIEGIQVLKAVREVRAVFIDLHLPGMDGLTFTRKARRMDPLLYICAMTGYSNIFSLIEAREAGADDFLAKPIDVSTLLCMVDDIYNRVLRWNTYRD